ncbi:MAG TPA: aminopeptidase P family protein [Candidatus Eisenbergiella pullistercoris]|uniref:Aminopeptidase P family protein n=1 Tax=Candidatus Eisenbergiella pullistercoris TaxID=2838555 RepID=A0A9D1YRU8_9FIRM|nr:aminopeptidase P family protein [Candidatus Eisenbergiella pullistercoris]
MNQRIQERVAALREEMKKAGVDYYMVPTADFHNSEYVDRYFKMREYLSGFTGSNGTLVVCEEEAGLWTDGRYFIQAEKELAGTGIRLFRMLDEGVPTIQEYLKQNMKEGQTLGFDGRVVDTALGRRLEKALAGKNIRFAYDRDLGDAGWTDRPALPCHPVTVLDEAICGKTAGEKLADVRQKMKEAGADAFLLSKLDDLMWLLNIRGADVECNPVALSYAYLTKDDCFLFIQEGEVTQELKDHASKYGVTLLPYGQVVSFLKERKEKETVLFDVANTSYALSCALQEKGETVEGKNPTELMKAIKNEVELSHMEEVYRKDSAAVCKFIYWLKKNVGKRKITEVTAAQYLDGLRSQIDGYLDLSFPTISGYQENAAMMHYEAEPETCKELRPEGMLLVDSGGQYVGGTTDVTRTIVLGPVSDEIKEHFTAVAVGMLALTNARFLYGCTGRNLDILARQPMWNRNIDYKCGTGHGVGYILNVHEGPQGIRWRFTEGQSEAVIEAGMDVTNEPGIYIEGSHGIRTENVMVARNGVRNGDGQFMYFDTLTWAPIDLDAIDPAYMEPREIAWLNDYHAKVYEKIAPLLDEEERAWLKEATRPLPLS